MLALVLGGARSGKTAAAERLAAEAGRPVVYLATAVPGDAEFRARVAAHRRRRSPDWTTIEERLLVPEVVRSHPTETVIVDCLGMFVTNLLLRPDTKPEEVLRRVADLVDAAAAHRGLVVVVSNEVGQGVVPAGRLGRTFRDTLGLANQAVAARAGRVLYTVAGIAVDLRKAAAFAPEGPGET